MTLGERLKEQRKATGLSQEKVAELMGVSRQAVTKWEANQSVPSSDNLIALSSLFQIPLDRLITGDEGDTPIVNPMSKSNSKIVAILLIIFLLISNVTFVLLWQKGKEDKSDYLEIAQIGASSAVTMFSEYQKDGEESTYWKGVAAFYSFEQAYYLLVEGTNKSSNYNFCNDVYGSMVLFPAKCQQHITDIIEVMDVVSNDIEGRNGFLLMENLRNSLNHEE